MRLSRDLRYLRLDFRPTRSSGWPIVRARQQWTTHLTTLNSQIEEKVFRVTHPFHPLSGQEFNILSRRCIDGEDFLFFQNVENHNNIISSHWTSLKPPNPYIVISDGRSIFCPIDLLELVQLIRDLKVTTRRVRRKKVKKGLQCQLWRNCHFIYVAGHRMAMLGCAEIAL